LRITPEALATVIEEPVDGVRSRTIKFSATPSLSMSVSAATLTVMVFAVSPVAS
jgi:hypothetical protein